MDFFDQSDAPPEIPDDLFPAVNAVITTLRGKLVREIVLPEGPRGLRVPNLVRGYLQAHLRRMLTFLDGGLAEHRAGRPLMTELATRAIYENIASFCDFTAKLKPLCEAVDYAGIEKHASKAAFVTRIPAFLEEADDDLTAPNILTQIDKLKRFYPGIRESYDHLSDIVHPNGLGAVVYFSKMADGVMTFADSAMTPERAMHSLFCAAMFLAYVEVELEAAEQALAKVVDIVTNRPVDSTPP